MDPLQALLMPVGDDEQMKALARSLRGRQTAADFFSASSIPQLQQMAQSEQKYIQDVGERQGVLREALERRKQDQAQHDAQMAFREEELTQRGLDRAEDRALRETLAHLRGNSGGYNSPSTQKERAAFDAGSSDLESFESLADTFQDSYSGSVPMAGGLENAYFRYLDRFNPLTSEEMSMEGKDQAVWWSDYKKYAELVQRHGLFGSALTKPEKDEWQKATITPNDDPEIVKTKLASQRDFIRRKTEKAAAQAMMKGYNPEEIKYNFGGAIDVDSLAERLSSGDYSLSDDEPLPEATDDPTNDLQAQADDLQAQADEAIARGADPDVVMRRLNEMLEELRNG